MWCYMRLPSIYFVSIVLILLLTKENNTGNTRHYSMDKDERGTFMLSDWLHLKIIMDFFWLKYQTGPTEWHVCPSGWYHMGSMSGCDPLYTVSLHQQRLELDNHDQKHCDVVIQTFWSFHRKWKKVRRAGANAPPTLRWW